MSTAPEADEIPRASTSSKGTNYRDLRAVPGFFRLITASACSKSAARMYQILLVLFVLATFHSARLSGFVLLTSQLPGIVLSPIAGALLDRKGRVLLMSMDYLVAGVSVTLVLVLSVAHLLTIPLLFVIVGVGSVTQPLSSVGSRSLYPAIVPRHLWDRSNGLDSTTLVIAQVLGPAAAGLGVAAIGVKWALVMPVVLYLCASVALLGVNAPQPVSEEPAGLVADAIGAVRYVFTNRVLRQLSMTVTIFNAGTAVTTVAVPVLVISYLHGGSTTAGLMIATLGFFGFVSSLTMGAFGTSGRERTLMVTACCIAATGLALCSLSLHSEVLAFGALAVTGVANGPLTVTMFTLRQRVTDPKWFGRAFAVSMNLNGAGAPLGAGAVGLIVAHSVPAAFLFGAGLVLFSGVWPIVFPYNVPATAEVVAALAEN